MRPLLSLEEKERAIGELLKLLDQNVPDFKRKEELANELVRHGLTEERAAELADWAIEWLYQNRQLTREEELQQLRETVSELLEQGKNTKEIADEMEVLGVTEEDVVKLVQSIIGEGESEEKREPAPLPGERMDLARKYARHMWYGVLWVLGGIVVAAAASKVASSDLRAIMYVAAGVTVFFGFANFVSGHLGLLKSKSGHTDESVEEAERDFACPVCGRDIKTEQMYCPGCGSEIDWSDS